MNNADFWASIRGIITQGFTLEGLQTLAMQNSLSVGSLYINDFHRSNSVAAQREVRHMSLHPFSREQKIRQIRTIHQLSTRQSYVPAASGH